MENKYQRLLNEMVTGWENTLQKSEAREIQLRGSGKPNDEVTATAVSMANDALRNCIEMTRQLMTDCKRLDNHENKMVELINNLSR